MTRVLVVDDDPAIRRALELNLRAHGYRVTCAATGEDALARAELEHPELIVLDLGLPGIDGVEVLRTVRTHDDVPVIVLTARHDERDKVVALDAGADDFLIKPFGVGELLARMRAILRRTPLGGSQPKAGSSGAAPVDVVETPDFTIDLRRKSATTKDGTPTRLTPIEWAIVEHLCRNEGQLVSQRDLITAVWDADFDPDRALVRVHLQHIRRKLEPNPSAPCYFLTEPGLGLRFQSRGSVVS